MDLRGSQGQGGVGEGGTDWETLTGADLETAGSQRGQRCRRAVDLERRLRFGRARWRDGVAGCADLRVAFAAGVRIVRGGARGVLRGVAPGAGAALTHRARCWRSWAAS